MALTNEIEKKYIDRSKVAGIMTLVVVLLLEALFVGLKMTGTVDWTWKWVMSPLWIYGYGLLTLLLLLTVVVSSLSFGKHTGTVLVVMLSGVFAVLKLTGVLDWTWWAVFSPIWVPSLFGISLLGFIATGILIWNTGAVAKKQVEAKKSDS